MICYAATGWPPNVEVHKIGSNNEKSVHTEPYGDSFSDKDCGTRFNNIPEMVGEITGFDEYGTDLLSREDPGNDEGTIHLFAYGVRQLALVTDFDVYQFASLTKYDLARK